MISKRNYGIDILRLVMMFMICILHCLNQGGILNGVYLWNILLYGVLAFRNYLLLCS